jgi:hypothetical protein
LCIATLGDGRISSSFVVVRRKRRRRRRRSSYFFYAIRKTPKKIQIKQIKGGGDCIFFSFNGDGQLAKQRRRRGQKKNKEEMGKKTWKMLKSLK